jgi:pSer/pThr/pTyr-binding forkhead associated (FHA) protein
MNDRIQLLHLFQPDTQRRLRVEVPTVFGRSGAFHRYTDEVRISDQEEAQLARFDYVEITGDNYISRTHGVLHPDSLTIQDLNSRNGTQVNGTLIKTTRGKAGPPHALKAGDVLKVGKLHFVVQLDAAGENSFCGQLARDRHAILGPIGAKDLARLETFLSERKRCQSRQVTGWEQLKRGITDLSVSPSPMGITVVGLVAEPLGEQLRLGDDTVDVGMLLAQLNRVPGSKIVALQATGDPSGCEAIFRDLAYQDTILLTSNVPMSGGLEVDLEPDLCTAPKEGLRRAVKQGAGTYDSVIDGLDALLRPLTNVLEVDWVQGYEGALRLVVGTQLHVDYEVELSYRTDIRPTCAATGWPDPGSSRRPAVM